MLDKLTLAEQLQDIARRNAGKPTLTIWKDGSYLVQGERDAEIDTRCSPEEVLLNINIETMEPLVFRTREELQDSIRLHEKLLVPFRTQNTPE